jgi:hypothetical protein
MRIWPHVSLPKIMDGLAKVLSLTVAYRKFPHLQHHKSRRLSEAGGTFTHMVETRNANKCFISKPQGMRPDGKQA